MDTLKSKQYRVLFTLVFAWGILVTGGFVWASIYQAKPGIAPNPPVILPQEIITQLGAPAHNSLLVFIHPQCVCSEASLNELNRLQNDLEFPPRLFIFFANITDTDANRTGTLDSSSKTPTKNNSRIRAQAIEQTSLWQQAINIKNSVVALDTDRKIAGLFNTYTSGDVILYSTNGKLLYHGGITAARGHQGDSRGRDYLLELLQPKQAKITEVRMQHHESFDSEVYGCLLMDKLALTQQDIL